MGGMLAVGAMSQQGYLSRRVRSITMMASGCYGAGSWHSVLKPIVLLLSVCGFPGKQAGSLMGALAGTRALALLEGALYWRSNIQVRSCRQHGCLRRGATSGCALGGPILRRMHHPPAASRAQQSAPSHSPFALRPVLRRSAWRASSCAPASVSSPAASSTSSCAA